jgi:hypothetical protein
VKSFPIYLYIFIILGSCSSPVKRDSLKPQSVGNLAELVVLSNFNDEEYKGVVNQIFQKSLDGYPPPGESSFKTLFTDQSFYKGYFKKHHNVFILLTIDHLPDLSKVIDNSILNSVINTYRSKPSIIGIKQVDLFAKNQSIFFVIAKNREEMMDKLSKNSNQLHKLALDHESNTGKKILLGNINYSNNPFSIRSLKNKNYAIRKPKSYRIAIENSDFVWLRKVSSVKEQQFGIMMFESPYRDSNDLSLDSILKVRNFFTKKYVPGETPNSFMKYSTAITPVMRKSDYNNNYSADIYGWWDVFGDFMGGPSHLKIVVDEPRKRIIYIEGFLFFPNESKAQAMRELSILINTLKIQ